MKIKIDRATADHTRAIISYGLHATHGNILISAMLHEQLCPFTDKLHNPWSRKTKVFNVSATLAACLHTVYKCAEGVTTGEASQLVMLEYVIKPLVKQIQQLKYS